MNKFDEKVKTMSNVLVRTIRFLGGLAFLVGGLFLLIYAINKGDTSLIVTLGITGTFCILFALCQFTSDRQPNYDRNKARSGFFEKSGNYYDSPIFETDNCDSDTDYWRL